MDINIKALHFDASEKLESYIEKKVSKLTKHIEGAEHIDVQLKVVKPQTVNNKETVLSLPAMGTTLRVEKICDTFEEGIDLCVDAMKVQIQKIKDKRRGE